MVICHTPAQTLHCVVASILDPPNVLNGQGVKKCVCVCVCEKVCVRARELSVFPSSRSRGDMPN